MAKASDHITRRTDDSDRHFPDRRRNRARRKPVNERRDLADLPSKGLLVDIQV